MKKRPYVVIDKDGITTSFLTKKEARRFIHDVRTHGGKALHLRLFKRKRRRSIHRRSR